MNWRRGFLRLWCVVAVLWIGAASLIVFPEWKDAPWTPPPPFKAESCENMNAENMNAETINRCDWEKFLEDFSNTRSVTTRVDMIAWLFGPPLGLLALGVIVTWIARGFHRPN